MYLLHFTYIRTHTHTHSLTFTFAAFMLPFTLLCPNKKLPSTRPKRKTQKIEREKRYSVAFLRLHSRDDGSVKWLLATRRRQATLILRVLFVNVAASPHSLSLSLALHRICRYCYQLSKAPHTHTHGNRLPHCITYAAPPLPSHTSSLRAHGSAWRWRWRWRLPSSGKNFLRIVSHRTAK